MYYRLQITTDSGEEKGYQWRELDIDLFTQIITGQRPIGDADAQSRDSTQVDTAGENRPMYYSAIWSDSAGWINSATAMQASEYYNTLGQETPGA